VGFCGNLIFFIVVLCAGAWGCVQTPNWGVSKMQLSKIGGIVQKYWDEIPQHFPFIKLDKMVVMPNHIHGILWIDKPTNNTTTSQKITFTN